MSAAIAARTAIRSPRAAAVAGIVFSVLLTASLGLVRSATPSDPDAAGDWLTDDNRRRAVVVALNLLPFAAIAFLWFIGVVRDRIGEGEDRFFATVFLGSGLLFIAMMLSRPRWPAASCSPPMTSPSRRPDRESGHSVAESPTPCCTSTPCGWRRCSPWRPPPLPSASA